MQTELVTTLKREATLLLSDIERDREPILITQHGLPSAYLVDVESYERLQQRMTILEAVAEKPCAGHTLVIPFQYESCHISTRLH